MKKDGKSVRRLDTFHNSDKCKGRVQINFVYLVEGFELWIEGVCFECEARVRSIISLEELILMTPNPQNKPFWKPSLPKSKKLQKKDLDFLRELGIDPNGGENEPKN